ncbi:MAG: hypothetical protein L6277_06355 [Desulfobacterales bacterium]|nr:hypothetical protein [Pseudomonadota bacterium]MCG2771694.1 hypothetical protein [Desulfobacterales bacterium]
MLTVPVNPFVNGELEVGDHGPAALLAERGQNLGRQVFQALHQGQVSGLLDPDARCSALRSSLYRCRFVRQSPRSLDRPYFVM